MKRDCPDPWKGSRYRSPKKYLQRFSIIWTQVKMFYAYKYFIWKSYMLIVTGEQMYTALYIAQTDHVSLYAGQEVDLF